MVTTSSPGQAVAGIVTRRMQARSVSAKSLAEQTGIPRTTLNRRLAGHSPFTVNELSSVARVLATTAIKIMAAADQGLAA